MPLRKIDPETPEYQSRLKRKDPQQSQGWQQTFDSVMDTVTLGVPKKLVGGAKTAFDSSKPLDERVGGAVDVAEAATTLALPVGAGVALGRLGVKAGSKLLAKGAAAGIATDVAGQKGAELAGAGPGVQRAVGFAAGSVPVGLVANQARRLMQRTPQPQDPTVTVTPEATTATAPAVPEPLAQEIPATPIRKPYLNPQQKALRLGPSVAEERAALGQNIARTERTLPRLREDAKAQKAMEAQGPGGKVEEQLSLFVTDPNEVKGPLPTGTTPEVGISDRQQSLFESQQQLDSKVRDASVAPDTIGRLKAGVDEAAQAVEQPPLGSQEQGTLLTDSWIPVRGNARELYKTELLKLRDMKSRMRKLSKYSDPKPDSPEQGSLWTTGEIPVSPAVAETNRQIQLNEIVRNKEQFDLLSPQEQKRILNELKGIEKKLYKESVKFQRSRVKYAQSIAKASGSDPAKAAARPPWDPSTPIEAYAQANILEAETAKAEKDTKTWGEWFSFLKRRTVDSFAPIEDRFWAAMRRNGYAEAPKENISDQHDRTLRSDKFAFKWMKEEKLMEFIQSFKDAKESGLFGQFLISKHLNHVAKTDPSVYMARVGPERTIDQVRAAEQELERTYEPVWGEKAKYVTNLSNKFMDYLVENGVIQKAWADEARKLYPSYITISHLMDDNFVPDPGWRDTAASLRKQTVFNKLEGGGQGPIDDPLQVMLERFVRGFKQVEKNKTARMLVGYAGLGDPALKLDEFIGLLTEVKPAGVPGPDIIVWHDQGVPRWFKAPEDIAVAANSLERAPLADWLRVASMVTSAFRFGITGGDPAFAPVNLTRDQQFGLISATAPRNARFQYMTNYYKSMFKSIAEVLKQGELYHELEGRGALGSVFDAYRGSDIPKIEKIISERSTKDTLKYVKDHPVLGFKDGIRRLEDFLAQFDEFSRLQHWQATYKTAKQQNLDDESAKNLADRAARWTTTNFLRSGDVSRNLSAIYPYLNAGIQGSRRMVRGFKNDPAGTTVKFMTLAVAPVMATLAWNLSDEKRRRIYGDLHEDVRRNNLVIISSWAKLDPKDNRYDGVLTIPTAQGYANVVSPLRRIIETAYDVEPIRTTQLLDDFVQTFLPFNPISAEGARSGLIPQLVKPAVEVAQDRNSFTGGRIDTRKNNQEAIAPVKMVAEGLRQTLGRIDPKLSPSPAQLQHLTEGYLGRFPADQSNYEIENLGPFGRIAKKFTRPYGGYRKRRLQDEQKLRQSSNNW